ncbi:MAG: transposase [Bacteroidetes bacterium]|nr:transposase [Bacteroidota bacterium]
MSEKYKFFNSTDPYFVTSTIVNWIDLFTRKEFCHIIIDSLNYCSKEKGLILNAWCIMPSHLHLIIRGEEGIELSGIMRDFKKYTSKKIVSEMRVIHESRSRWLHEMFLESGAKLKRIKKYKVWQDGVHPIHLDTNAMINQRLNYLHNNPIKSGMVYKAEDYVWSSAGDYEGTEGLLKIELLD